MNPYFVRVVSDLKEQMVSIISDEIEIRADFDFYERPYLFKFKDPLSAAPKTVLKFFLKLPLMQKLVLEAGKTDVVVEKYAEEKRKIWHGQVYEGVLCSFMEPRILLKPEKGDFANMPVRFLNKHIEPREIKKFLVNPEYLTLYEGENGLFTNKVYIDILEKDEFNINYGRETTKQAGKAKVLIQAKGAAKGILQRFDPIRTAREFGL